MQHHVSRPQTRVQLHSRCVTKSCGLREGDRCGLKQPESSTSNNISKRTLPFQPVAAEPRCPQLLAVASQPLPASHSPLHLPQLGQPPQLLPQQPAPLPPPAGHERGCSTWLALIRLLNRQVSHDGEGSTCREQHEGARVMPHLQLPIEAAATSAGRRLVAPRCARLTSMRTGCGHEADARLASVSSSSENPRTAAACALRASSQAPAVTEGSAGHLMH